jgi:hypothetical protein
VIPLNHLPAEQKRHYEKLLRSGMGRHAARQMATAT